MNRKRMESWVKVTKPMIAALAAKVDAPAFPGPDADQEDIERWLLDVAKKIGSAIAAPDTERLNWLELRETDIREGPDGASIGLLRRDGTLLSEAGNLRDAIDCARTRSV